MEVLSAIETYTTVEVPMKAFELSTSTRPNVLFSIARSERRVESRPALTSSAGLRIKTTAVARTARMAITTRSSIKVKDSLLL